MLSSNQKSTIQAIFLDRDGVIIYNREKYVRRWEDVKFYSSSLRALRAINHLAPRPKVFIITNQSAIGRGLMTIEDYQEINRKIQEVIFDYGGVVDQVFFCPHTPDEKCNCRKPQPGMIFTAARQYDLDLRRSVLIGDACSDIEAGFSAGIPNLYLVSTGRGKKQQEVAKKLSYYHQIHIHHNLFSVIKEIL